MLIQLGNVISGFDADSVDVNNMTQADQMKLLGNLVNMKLYKYIAPLMQSGV